MSVFVVFGISREFDEPATRHAEVAFHTREEAEMFVRENEVIEGFGREIVLEFEIEEIRMG